MSEQPHDALVGQIIGGCAIEARLARGGMATVYRAHQLALGRAVALKVLPPHGGAAAVARFQRETEVTARLEHPHILGLYGYGEHHGQLYLVMPLIAGGTLEQRLRAEPAPPRDWLLARVLQVCSALDYAHRQRVVHRDVKPSNIFLRDEHWALLADFGIARLLESTRLTAPGLVVGTPEYMAPEHGQGLAVDYRADIYSVGILLYRLLAGHLPFRGSPIDVMRQQVEAPLPPLGLDDPRREQLWTPLLARALAKAPTARYGSAAELSAAIQAAMQAEQTLDAHTTGAAAPRADRSSVPVLSPAASVRPEADPATSGASHVGPSVPPADAVRPPPAPAAAADALPRARQSARPLAIVGIAVLLLLLLVLLLRAARLLPGG